MTFEPSFLVHSLERWTRILIGTMKTLAAEFRETLSLVCNIGATRLSGTVRIIRASQADLPDEPS